ncbi:class I SAM-dependent methyltransferase [Curvivirga aplysinae]|uniref:class I SAM-dependent methyltransferase n=1 Tax=Curvivirga aplysinae TaxID=2529852 RepID=UPI0012BBED59|nr:class I SAM-dependent methyltransferase [Curvivirga aplysinae]MTI09657.1 class I SAM-dependent methyltransferase [Curvivirga aplysinae]
MKTNSKEQSALIRKGIIPGPTALTGIVVAICAFGIVWSSTLIISIDLAVWIKTAIFAVSAMILCIPFQLPRWWIAIFAILPTAYLIMEGQSFPIWIYPTLAGGLLLLNWNSFRDRVPLYLSNKKTVETLSQFIDEKIEIEKFYDLGCGIGSALIPLAKRHPNKDFIGIETAPLTWFILWIACKLSGCKNVQIHRKSIWDISIKDADLVYAFLSPHPMDKLLLKCKKELPKGAVLISNSFDSEKFPAKEMIPVQDRRQTKLLIWEF